MAKNAVRLWRRSNKCFYLCYRQDGKIVRQCLDHNDEALAARQAAKKSAELGCSPDAAEMRLWDLCYAYLTSCRRIESSTADGTERAFGLLCECGGNVRLMDFGIGEAEKFQGWVVFKKHHAEVSANIYCKALAPVFAWAFDREFIAVNPWRKLRLYKVVAGEVVVWTHAEFQRVMDVSGRLWRARLLLARTAGLRRGEVLNLMVCDCDFAKRRILVREHRPTPFSWAWKPKDKELRTLPMVEPLERLLVELVAHLPEGQPYVCLTPKNYQLVMRRKDSGLLSDRLRKKPDDDFNRDLDDLRKLAKVKDRTFHDLRRTCISDWSAVLPPKEVMILAGHSDIKTTMKYYVRHCEQYVDRAREASEKVLSQPCAQNSTICAHDELSKVLEHLRQLLGRTELTTVGLTGLEPATS